MKKTLDIIRAAKAAAPILAAASPEQKNLALEKIACRLLTEQAISSGPTPGTLRPPVICWARS